MLLRIRVGLEVERLGLDLNSNWIIVGIGLGIRFMVGVDDLNFQ